MRRLAVPGWCLPLLAACAIGGPVVAPVPGAPAGPRLVLDVTNESPDERSIGFEWEGQTSAGGGEGPIAACHREAMQFGPLSGEYRVLVDGEAVWNGVAPNGLGADAVAVIRVRIGPDGAVNVAEPILVAAAPNVSAEIPGCAGSGVRPPGRAPDRVEASSAPRA
jgi:hypothetical protein